MIRKVKMKKTILAFGLTLGVNFSPLYADTCTLNKDIKDTFLACVKSDVLDYNNSKLICDDYLLLYETDKEDWTKKAKLHLEKIEKERARTIAVFEPKEEKKYFIVGKKYKWGAYTFIKDKSHYIIKNKNGSYKLDRCHLGNIYYDFYKKDATRYKIIVTGKGANFAKFQSVSRKDCIVEVGDDLCYGSCDENKALFEIREENPNINP